MHLVIRYLLNHSKLNHVLCQRCTITNTVSSIIVLRIEGGQCSICTPQSYANSRTQRPALTIAISVIITWRGSTIPISINPSSAPTSPMICITVSISNSVHSLTLLMRSRSTLFIPGRRMRLSTCMSSKQNGVPSHMNTIRHSVCTHIIGKISGGSLICFSTMVTSVLTGNHVRSSVTTLRDVHCRNSVSILMDGRRRTTTLTIIRPINVQMEVHARKSLSAQCTMISQITDILLCI